MREVLGGDLHGLHGTGGGGNSRSRTTAMYQAGVGGDGLGATPSSAGPGPLVGELTLSKLAAADLHGALVTVVRSRCVSRVGIRGIVVRDRRGVLEIVVPPSSKRQKTGGEAVDVNMTQGEDRGQDQIGGDTHGKGSDGEVKMVPKEGTVFRIEVSLDDDDDPAVDGGRKRFVFEMLGDQFIYRSAERATRKFKAHYVKDL